MYHINHVSAKNTDLIADDTLVDFKPTSSDIDTAIVIYIKV
jgi:hypothetical protein